MEKELLKDSTRKSMLSDISEHIPFYESQLQNVLLPLKNHKNFDKIEKEYEIKLIYSLMNLDFYVSVKNYLSSIFYWENVMAFKQIYKIIFESHNKISGKVFFSKENGLIDYVTTQKNQSESLWFGKTSSFITNENKSDYNRISGILEEFKAKTDFKYITKIRNFDGHYSNLEDYMIEIKSIDMDKTIQLAIQWTSILMDVDKFSFVSLLKKLNS